MPQTKDIAYYSSFIQRYRDYSTAVATSTAESDIGRFRKVITSFVQEKSNILLADRVEASAYNLFDILHIPRRETVTHTPFLINLLNPTGSHSQGDLFYRSFLKATTSNAECFMDYHPAKLVVQEEHYASEFGRVDILVHHKDIKNPFALVIENKIDAGDQQNQLLRYYEYLRYVLAVPEHKIRIYYLTKFGEHPSTHSIPDLLKRELIQKGILHLISYKQTISEWLQSIRTQIRAERVAYTIDQYITLIKRITL